MDYLYVLVLQKLQHVKAESEREITTLKRKVADLERQLGTGSSTSTNPLPQPNIKRRRIY